jgi:bacterioferritin
MSLGLQRHPKVIELLNTQLTRQLTKFFQYFFHARKLQSFGVAKLAKREYFEFVHAMRHADELTKHLLRLDGLSGAQRINTIWISKDLQQIFRADRALEEEGLSTLRESIIFCESLSDLISRDLLLGILMSTEDHIEFLDRQSELIEEKGLTHYVLLNIPEGSGEDHIQCRAADPGLNAVAINDVEFAQEIDVLVKKMRRLAVLVGDPTKSLRLREIADEAEGLKPS